MQATIQLDHDDFAAARRFGYGRLRLHSTFALVLVSVTLLTFLTLPASMAWTDRVGWTLLWGPFVVTIYTAGLYWMVERRARKVDEAKAGTAEVSIDDTSFTEVVHGRSRTLQLARILGIESTDERLLIDIGGDVVVLPFDQLGSDAASWEQAFRRGAKVG